MVTWPVSRALSVSNDTGWFGVELVTVLQLWGAFLPAFGAGLLAALLGGPSRRPQIARLLWRWVPAWAVAASLSLIGALVAFRLSRGLSLLPYQHHFSGGHLAPASSVAPAHVQALLILSSGILGMCVALSLARYIGRDELAGSREFVSLLSARCWLSRFQSSIGGTRARRFRWRHSTTSACSR